MTTVVSQPRPTAAEQARAFHRGYLAHVRVCDACIGALCPTGRDLELDADAAGWRADHAPDPEPVEQLVISNDGSGWWSAAA
jgi:hypothetical protein